MSANANLASRPDCDDFGAFVIDDAESLASAVQHSNACLARRDAAARIQWALARLPGPCILSSSFGATAAVSLHLLTRVQPDIPIVLIDTGYLFPETYRFIDELTERLSLNLHVYRPRTSAAWQEARHGKRWERGLAGIQDYNRDNKVEPMQRALAELEVGTWFAGLRRQQGRSRAQLEVLQHTEGHWKVHPIIDWTDRDVYQYLKREHLPYHPLWEQGYVSIGDVHTTKSLHEVDAAEATRFFGLKRECGIHEIGLTER